MADEIKTGDYVYRKKQANDHLWKAHGYGYGPMRVTGTEGGHLQFNYKAYMWSRSCFERVNALQPGDIVMRKAEFRDYGGWKWGSQLHEVDSIYGNEVRLKGNSFDWSIENFDLVLRRNNLAAAQSALDEATKPLHHTIELRDARIRVLEGEVATLKDEAGLMRSHMRREGRRCLELEDEVVQLKVGLKEAEERLCNRTAWSGELGPTIHSVWMPQDKLTEDRDVFIKDYLAPALAVLGDHVGVSFKVTLTDDALDIQAQKK